ncbi:MAG: hypothetical protein PHI79_07345 [Sulfurovaceae bacterium]|nr:hypothetical protein [Sulfurovaceae bacterium]MDD5549388.1 hypothetical protein [Sulfurovaceae bacterium]
MENTIDYDLTKKVIKLPDGLEIPGEWFLDAIFRKKMRAVVNRWAIKDKFKKLGMTYDEYSEKYGLDKETLGRYLTGDINGSRKKTKALIDIENQLTRDGVIGILQ